MSTSLPSGASSVELEALWLWLKPPGCGFGLTVPGWLAWLSLTRRMLTGWLAPGTSWPSRLADGTVENTSRLACVAPPTLQVSRKWNGPATPSSICEVPSRNLTPPEEGVRVLTTCVATLVASPIVNGHWTMKRVGAVTGVDGMRTIVPSLKDVGRLTLNVPVGTFGSSGIDGMVGKRLTRAKGFGRDPTPLGKPTLGGFSLHEASLVAAIALSVPTLRVSTPTSLFSDELWAATALAAPRPDMTATAPATASARIQDFLILLPLWGCGWTGPCVTHDNPAPGGPRGR